MFKAKKALGQNFISDPYIIERIVDASQVGPFDTVVEIGPGKGALTCSLAERARRVIAVELDSSVIPLLKGNLAGAENVQIYNEDILKFDWSKALEGLGGVAPAGQTGGMPDGAAGQGVLRVIGNLPYYITTPILLGILEKDIPAKSITVMVQKEVADRIVAPPGGRDRGVLSLSLQYYAECSKVLDVPAEYFDPRPKVDSAVVHMVLKEQRLLAGAEEKDFFAVVKAAFSQRRKTLLNSLAASGLRLGGCAEGQSIQQSAQEAIAAGTACCPVISKSRAAEVLAAVGIDPQRRPETLEIAEFAALTKALRA